MEIKSIIKNEEEKKVVRVTIKEKLKNKGYPSPLRILSDYEGIFDNLTDEDKEKILKLVLSSSKTSNSFLLDEISKKHLNKIRTHSIKRIEENYSFNIIKEFSMVKFKEENVLSFLIPKERRLKGKITSKLNPSKVTIPLIHLVEVHKKDFEFENLLFLGDNIRENM